MSSTGAPKHPVDCIYITVSMRDARFARICVASVRMFYPDVPVRLLVGGPLQPGLVEELVRYWNVTVEDRLALKDYGWGFVKLEPLFFPAGERFLVLDADTVMTGPVLDLAEQSDADFIVDNEAASEETVRTIYYDVEEAAREGQVLAAPRYVFNSGQLFVRSGLLRREDFNGLIAWGEPPKLVNGRVFKNGDQGVLNYVLNERDRQGVVTVSQAPLMWWPGNGMERFAADAVAERKAPAVVIHWAGLKQPKLRQMLGADLLTYFERAYYRRLPGGEARRILASWRHIAFYEFDVLRTKVRQRKAAAAKKRAPS